MTEMSIAVFGGDRRSTSLYLNTDSNSKFKLIQTPRRGRLMLGSLDL
jgi:hypothetical protein